MMYRALEESSFESDGFLVVPIREADIMLIREWRNEQMDVLRQQQAISEEQQALYFDEHVWPTLQSTNPNQILFSYLDPNGICIGYGGLVHISWRDRRAEVSFLLDTMRAKSIDRYTDDFSRFLSLIKRAGQSAGLHRLFTETYAFRSDHIRVLEQAGFELEGKMRDHVIECGRFHDSLIHGLLLDREGTMP